MVEQLTLNQLVRGSSPRPATSGFFDNQIIPLDNLASEERFERVIRK